MLGDGASSLARMLGGSSVALPLNAGDARGSGRPGGLSVWASGDRRRYSGVEDDALAWDGDVFGFQLGADAWAWPDLLAGLSVARFTGAFDYSDRTDPLAVDGRYDSRMTSVHPYLGWYTSDRDVGLWATLGYGEGDIEIDDLGGRRTSDTVMQTVSVGATAELHASQDVIAGGETTLRLKSHGSTARVEVRGNGAGQPAHLAGSSAGAVVRGQPRAWARYGRPADPVAGSGCASRPR